MSIEWSKDLTAVPMNSKQRAWVERARANLIMNQVGAAHAEKYEFKELGVAPWPGDAVALRVTIGRKNDEGTAAAIFCRDTFMFVFGRRGGLTCHTFVKPFRILKGGDVRWMLANKWIPATTTSATSTEVSS